jgi:peroxiredoxin Q/BCP
MTELKAGDKAPAISLKNQEGKKVTLKEFKGKKVVLFFYPKDMTPTCTVEACNLRDNYSLLQKQGIEVIGISPDDETSHLKFADKHELGRPIA